MKGRLIILDGIDGSGITTQAKLLYNFLKDKNKKVFLLKEPKNKNIIDLIKKNKEPLIDLFLFLIDRKLNYNKIFGYLKEGYIVICERSFPSTLVYQYFTSDLRKNIKEDLVFYLNHLAMNHIKPDLVIIFDVEVKEALRRLKSKTKKSKIKKYENKDFLEKAKKGYIYFAKKYNWILVDSNKPINEVFEDVKKTVSKII